MIKIREVLAYGPKSLEDRFVNKFYGSHSRLVFIATDIPIVMPSHIIKG